MKSIYKITGGTYQRQGDYELPNLKLPTEKEIEIGVWGQRYRRHLKQNHRIQYYNLLTAGMLNERAYCRGGLSGREGVSVPCEIIY